MQIKTINGIAVEVATAEKKYIFYFVTINGIIIIKSCEDLIALSELFGGFVSNFLDLKTTYDFGTYSAKIVQKDGVYSLAVMLDEDAYYFTKFECKLVTGLLNRIIARVDIFKNVGARNPELIMTKKGK